MANQNRLNRKRKKKKKEEIKKKEHLNVKRASLIRTSKD